MASEPGRTPVTHNVAGTGLPLVALGAALWGSDALFRRGLALSLPAPLVVFGEHAILVAVLLPVLIRAVRRLRGRLDAREWLYLVLIGAGASVLATTLFTLAFTYGDPTTPLLLQKVQPLIAVLGARLLLGERLVPRYGVYFASALVGAYLISLPDPTAVSVRALAPALMAVAAAVFWGMGTVLGRKLGDKIGYMELTALRVGIGLPVAAAVLLFVDRPMGQLAAMGAQDVLALVLLALIPGLAGLVFFYRGLRSTPASAATLAELAFPVSAVSINYLAFGTTLTVTQTLGLVLLATTITVMSLRGARAGSRAVGVEVAPPEPASSR